jgi:O-acetylhomoserine (thiol)-lyase
VERHVENALKAVELSGGPSEGHPVNQPKLADHPNHALYRRYFPKGGRIDLYL